MDRRNHGTRRSAALARAALAAAVLLGAAGCRAAAPPEDATARPGDAERPQRLPTATIQVGARPLVVEVAATEAQRRTGMMGRPSLGPDEAMLFVFLREDNLVFWMKDTPVDLDLAYLGADGTILQIEPMTAYNTDQVFSRAPARYALEVPAGWFAAHGIAAGARVTIPPEVMKDAEP
jgi:uncharacterized membrane protein (UPF0127 family)